MLELAGPLDPDRPAVSLAAAARRTLEGVASDAGDRSVALDLLAADALITLALLEQAERCPDRLGEFAAGLVRAAAS